MTAIYQTIKEHLTRKIEQGRLRPGDLVPSENALARQYSVSRMTARRALTELTDAGVLSRSQGAGTFVADQLATGSLLEIRSIHLEIETRGHTHSSRVLTLKPCQADKELAAKMGLPEGHALFESRILHFETDTNGQTLPIQLEHRFVNAEVAPDYGLQDFSQTTPSVYLSELAPLVEADHWVEACLPSANIAKHLSIEVNTPCLKVTRRTYSYLSAKRRSTRIVTFATLYHPGDRYRLGGHLKPGE